MITAKRLVMPMQDRNFIVLSLWVINYYHVATVMGLTHLVTDAQDIKKNHEYTKNIILCSS